MRILIFLALSFATVGMAHAGAIKMNFKDEEITNVIEGYAKATKQRFIVDPTVRGKISIFNPEEVSFEEAFNQLSTALAVNGFAIVKQDDVFLVKSARLVHKDVIEVLRTLPPLRPERMYTLVLTLRHITASEVNRSLRGITSKDGDLQVVEHNNQIVFTDWSSNLHHFHKLISEIDKPEDKSVSNLVKAARSEREKWEKAKLGKATETKSKNDTAQKSSDRKESE